MKRKLDDDNTEINNAYKPTKRGCYFQNYISILFKRENRLNAFEKANGEQVKKTVLQSICCNCQQLKKENQKISSGCICFFCDKFVCFECTQKCSLCDNDFCSFCSIQLYDDKNKDTCKCLNC